MSDLPIIDFPLEGSYFGSPTFGADSFDTAIMENGVDLIHHRAMKCPVGMIDPDDIRRPHEDHSGCSNGFIYTCAGKTKATILGNSREVQLQDVGRVDSSTIQATFTRFYTDKPDCRVQASFADRFYLTDDTITVVTWQVLAKTPTDYDSPNFPVVSVQDLIDANGKIYQQGADFDIENGKIHWLTNNRPSYDGTKGQVFTVRYFYRPFYYVQKMVHEIRMGKAQDGNTEGVMRLNQCALLVREIYFKTADQDPGSVKPNDPRQAVAAPEVTPTFDSILNHK